MHHSSVHSFPFFQCVAMVLVSNFSSSAQLQPSQPALPFCRGLSFAKYNCSMLLHASASVLVLSLPFFFWIYSHCFVCVCVCAVNVPYYMYLAAPGWLVICMHVCMASSLHSALVGDSIIYLDITTALCCVGRIGYASISISISIYNVGTCTVHSMYTLLHCT